MRDSRTLIDTSVWIAFFKNRDNHLVEKVEDVLKFTDVYVPKVVIAELIQGAKSEKGISVIEEFVEAFNIIDQTDRQHMAECRKAFILDEKKKDNSEYCRLLYSSPGKREQLQDLYA